MDLGWFEIFGIMLGFKPDKPVRTRLCIFRIRIFNMFQGHKTFEPY